MALRRGGDGVEPRPGVGRPARGEARPQGPERLPDLLPFEEFGDAVWAMKRLRSGGQDYLVVRLTTRILIYP